jgi:hypothetical protein
MSWRPIAEGALRARALDVVDEIADALAVIEPPSPSLAFGSAGCALFFSYLDAADPTRGAEALALDHYDRAVAAVERGGLRPTLYDGVLGIGWTGEHLQGRLFEPSDDDLHAELDELATTEIARGGTSYDLVEGCVGVGVYALARGTRGRPLLDRVMARLAERVVRSAGGLVIHTPASALVAEERGEHPGGYINLGLAHGLPGVIALLARAPASARAALLDGLVGGLRAYRLTAGGYPGLAPPDGDGAIRPAWCYGDLGVSVALYRAGVAAGEQSWRDEGLALATAIAARDDDCGIVDGGLCHGAFGLAHILSRFFNASGEPLFADAAKRWLARGLDLRVPGQGIAGYLAHRADGPARAEPGLLLGAAGIGLALLAATGDHAPDWDASLLCDLEQAAQ